MDLVGAAAGNYRFDYTLVDNVENIDAQAASSAMVRGNALDNRMTGNGTRMAWVGTTI